MFCLYLRVTDFFFTMSPIHLDLTILITKCSVTAEYSMLLCNSWALSLCLTCVCHSGKICHLPLMGLDNVNSLFNSFQQSVNNAVKCPNIMSHPNCLIIYICVLFILIQYVMSVTLGTGRPRQTLHVIFLFWPQTPVSLINYVA